MKITGKNTGSKYSTGTEQKQINRKKCNSIIPLYYGIRPTTKSHNDGNKKYGYLKEFL